DGEVVGTSHQELDQRFVSLPVDEPGPTAAVGCDHFQPQPEHVCRDGGEQVACVVVPTAVGANLCDKDALLGGQAALHGVACRQRGQVWRLIQQRPGPGVVADGAIQLDELCGQSIGHLASH